jgi:diguanylate cyclase (GGDEF)-like protein
MINRARKQRVGNRPAIDVTAPQSWFVWFFPILILAMVGAMLAWNAHVRYREFESYQQRLMESAVNGTAAEIGVFIGELRRSVHLFADTEHVLLDRLAANPDGEQALEKLTAAVHDHFPEAFAFTLANDQGEPLLDDFDGLVGEICINDMRSFATQREHSKVYLHPNPVAYHFDIMVDRERNGSAGGIFFVSFTTDILTRTLQHGEAPGHKLLLLKQDIPGLIEVSSDGARIKLQREFKLSTQEIQRIGYSRSVSGTSWDLVDLPDADLYANMRRDIQRETFLVMLAFLVVNGSMLWLLHRSQTKRQRLEHLLNHDAITGLPNHHLFLEKFGQMARLHAVSQSTFILFLIDPGQFRRLKGTFFEHRLGDALTKAVAGRLQESLGGASIVSKIDGSYVALISGLTPEQAGEVSLAVVSALSKPFGVDNDIILTNPCVGIAMYPQDGGDVSQLLRHAGSQIYAARLHDKHGHRILQPRSRHADEP